jgi:ABC-type transport system substrate-binding protein
MPGLPAAVGLVAATLLVLTPAASLGAPNGVGQSDDVARIALKAADVDFLDPALTYSLGAFRLVDMTCARLLTYSRRGALVPEVAAAQPRVSRGGTRYTFTLRRTFRFSDGTPVQASAFARTIDRILAPRVKSPWAAYASEIRGAKAVLTGRATHASGVSARGYSLAIDLVRPVPEFVARTTSMCAVPPALPSDREGVSVFPAAGPYYVADHRPAESVTIRRNPYYGGTRPQRVEGFDVDLRVSSHDEILMRIERGIADWGWAPSTTYFDPARRLAARFGVNRTRFFVRPGFEYRGYVLNSARPLFRDNPGLRRAVNFAIDRSAFHRIAGGTLVGTLTDQYLPPGMPGYVDRSIYPLAGPDLGRARSLARGNLRAGKATLHTVAAPLHIALAQSLKRDLAKIGLEVAITGIPLPAYFGGRGARGEYDIGFMPWLADYFDPYAVLNVLFDGRFIGATNWARLDSPKVNQRLRAAARLDGAARYRAYARLDAQLARDTAPGVPLAVLNDATLVSQRVGCVNIGVAGLDLSAICLK